MARIEESKVREQWDAAVKNGGVSQAGLAKIIETAMGAPASALVIKSASLAARTGAVASKVRVNTDAEQASSFMFVLPVGECRFGRHE